MGPHGHACIAFLPPYTCLRANSVERMSVVLNEIEMMIEVWTMVQLVRILLGNFRSTGHACLPMILRASNGHHHHGQACVEYIFGLFLFQQKQLIIIHSKHACL